MLSYTRDFFFLNLLHLVPRLRGDSLMRAWLVRASGARVGRSVKIKSGLVVEPIAASRNLVIGDDTFINTNVRLAARGKIEIGSNCAVGPCVCFETVNHVLEGGNAWATTVKETKVGNNVWIGAGAIILPGITIGDGAVIAAGSVVSRDVKPNTMVAGVPARKIREIR
jgi:maltose O-acetyltransferase